jgi:hypothetical protein
VLQTERPERDLKTTDLLRHALAEVKLLARAEIAHARLELRQELKAATRAGIALGAAATLGLVGLTMLFVTLALALPMAAWAGALAVALGALLLAAVAGLVGYRKLPRQPLSRTRARLLDDVTLAREHLQ